MPPSRVLWSRGQIWALALASTFQAVRPQLLWAFFFLMNMVGSFPESMYSRSREQKEWREEKKEGWKKGKEKKESKRNGGKEEEKREEEERERRRSRREEGIKMEWEMLINVYHIMFY